VSVELADFNGDGKLDAVVGDGGDFPLGSGGGVSILPGKGDGTFGAAASYSSGQFPVLQVHAADLNGDGKPDVVAAVANPDGQGGGVQVFLNKGDGTLRAPINVTFAESGITPLGFAIGDVNGDGHADLVVAYWNADITFKLAVMLGNGDGTFKAGPLMDDDAGTSPPLLLDLNGDGKLDLFLPHCCGAAEATHRLGNGDGTFQDAIYDGNGPGAQFAASIVRKSGRPLIALAGGTGSGVSGSAVYLGGSPAALTTPVGTPLITEVDNGGSFLPGFSQGSWVTIKGANLAGTTRIWTAADFVGPNLPTQLDGAGVTIDGKPAYVYFISPGQINVLAPADTASGSVAVQVTYGGAASNVVNAAESSLSPSLFLFDPQGRKYVAAVRSDGPFIGPPNLFGTALPTVPAHPGDVLLLFGTGFGPTNPASPIGTTFGTANPTATVTAKFGGHGSIRGIGGARRVPIQYSGPECARG
jgi:uncharacterized protein (TIGR03437 family)